MRRRADKLSDLHGHIDAQLHDMQASPPDSFSTRLSISGGGEAKLSLTFFQREHELGTCYIALPPMPSRIIAEQYRGEAIRYLASDREIHHKAGKNPSPSDSLTSEALKKCLDLHRELISAKSFSIELAVSPQKTRDPWVIRVSLFSDQSPSHAFEIFAGFNEDEAMKFFDEARQHLKANKLSESVSTAYLNQERRKSAQPAEPDEWGEPDESDPLWRKLLQEERRSNKGNRIG